MNKSHKDKDYHEVINEIKLKEKEGTQRGPDGKFLPGCAGGPGAKTLTKDKVRYHDILRKCTTDDEFKKVAMKLLEKAQAGEPWAIAQLLDRLMGKPKQFADIDIKQTNVDPKVIIQNITQILGLNDQGEEVYTVQKENIKEIEAKDD